MNRRWLLLALGGPVVLGAAVAALLVLRPRPRHYDIAGEAEWRAFIATQDHRARYAAFVALLEQEGVATVVPPWHLWRQGTDWRDTHEPAFAIPPKDDWSAIAPTLRLLRDEVVPLVGPIEVVSGFRTEPYNHRAGGAKSSRHMNFEAVDVIPKRDVSRQQLHALLLPWWKARGPAHRVGLGLYDGVRFHVDTHRHRRW